MLNPEKCLKSGTVVPGGTGVSPVEKQNHGQDARTTSYASPDHGRDAHATDGIHIRHGAYLPHWTKAGGMYAVTFRLHDSLPQHVLAAWIFEREKIQANALAMNRPLSEYEEKRLRELYSEKVEQYLDAGHGACWLKDKRIARIVADAFRHFDGDRYELAAWCIMPNHVHVIVGPLKLNPLPELLHTWKSFTAKQANKALGRTGQFWQEEYYDHLIRDECDFANQLRYVVENPAKAGLRNWEWVYQRGTGVPPVIPCVSGVPPVIPCVSGVPPVIPCESGVPPVEKKYHGQDARATTQTTQKGNQEC